MRNKMKKKVICGIVFAVILVAALFVKNKLFDGKMTCTGVITNRMGEWEYDSDCFIVIDSKYGGPWIVYESLEENNERFHKDLAYGDRVWISYTTDGYEIAPQQMEVVHILELKNDSKPAFETENISKIAFKFGPLKEVKVPSEDMEEIAEWLEIFKIGDRVKCREKLSPGTNSVSIRIEYLDGTIVENGLSTIKIDKKEYHLIYSDAPEVYWRLYHSVE